MRNIFFDCSDLLILLDKCPEKGRNMQQLGILSYKVYFLVSLLLSVELPAFYGTLIFLKMLIRILGWILSEPLEFSSHPRNLLRSILILSSHIHITRSPKWPFGIIFSSRLYYILVNVAYPLTQKLRFVSSTVSRAVFEANCFQSIRSVIEKRSDRNIFRAEIELDMRFSRPC